LLHFPTQRRVYYENGYSRDAYGIEFIFGGLFHKRY
jgi:hypothetical protein